MEGLNEAGTEGEDGDDEEIDNQGPFATVSIRDETEDDLKSAKRRRRSDGGIDTYGTSGAEQQGEGDRGCLILTGENKRMVNEED